MFTASHNPAQYNGIKLCRRGARPVGQDSGLAEVRDLAQQLLDTGADSAAGRGRGAGRHDHRARPARRLRGVPARAGRPVRIAPAQGRRRRRQRHGRPHRARRPRRPRRRPRPALPLDVVPLYFELDGTFPNHEANPLEPENLRDLQRAVVEHGADIGLAFDGDADRCFVVDERGEPVSPSAVTALVADPRDRQGAGRGPATPADVPSSTTSSPPQPSPRSSRERGARPVRTRVGHSFIKARDGARTRRCSAASTRAHYYFRDFWFADTGMLAAMHVLAALGEQDGPLTELVRRATSRYAASGEINSTVADAAAATAARARSGRPVRTSTFDELDGLTVTHQGRRPMWWFNLRASNTEPLLRLNVEAADVDTMERVRDDVLAHRPRRTDD